MLLVLAAIVTATSADAQPAQSGRQEATTHTPAPARRQPQGVAVVASGSARDDAYTLARAVYGSSLRPRSLDELRARILAGDPPPPSATKDVRELSELRAGVSGEDAASRRLLAAIAQQLDVQALLVVSRAPAPADEEKDVPPAASEDAGAPAAAAPAESSADAGGASPPAPARLPPPHVTARLFLAQTGELDAARYEPDAAGWRGTVTSLSSRFPPPATPAAARLEGPPPKLSSEGKDGKPFFKSPWLWGAVGAAVLIGGFFFFATQDTSDDPIHLQMRVPR